MIRTGIAKTARTVGVVVLAGAAALGLAMGPALGLAMGPSMGIAQAAPGTPDPPSGAGTLYGDPAAAAPFWRYQEYDDDCVEMAVADVVGELSGDQPPEHAIVKLAQSTPSPSHHGPIYAKPGKRRAGSGTSFDDEPALLAHYGIQAVSTDKGSTKKTGVPTGMKALEQDLAEGRKMIVGSTPNSSGASPSRTKPQTANPRPITPWW